MSGTELALPKTLLDFCTLREHVLARVEQAYALLQAANDDFEAAGISVGLPWDIQRLLRHEPMGKVRQYVDRQIWQHAFDLTGFRQLMDTQAEREFYESLEKDPPEFIEGNVRATFLSLAQQKEMLFVRGMVNVLRALSRHHRTNTTSPFRVNERAILCGILATKWSPLQLYVRHGQRLNDIDRVFKILDGKPHVPRSLECAINACFESRETVYEDSFYQIKGFLNGNIHIRFKRKDLLEEANRLIARFFQDEALAHAS